MHLWTVAMGDARRTDSRNGMGTVCSATNAAYSETCKGAKQSCKWHGLQKIGSHATSVVVNGQPKTWENGVEPPPDP